MAPGKIARGAALALVLVSGLAGHLSAEEWGGIAPGAGTRETVRARYGAPSRETRQKVEGYDTLQWVYEGARAPVGMKRLTVEFGLLTTAGYRPDLVRFFVLEPKPRMFDRETILNGWGTPDMIGEEKGRKVLFYKSGLVVYLDETGDDTSSMLFSIAQPDPAAARPR